MIYDSEQWRAKRDDILRDALRNDAALNFIRLIFEIGEQWDDLVDGDRQSTHATMFELMWLSIVDLQMDPFYCQHKDALLPVIIVGINAWQDSVKLEQGTRQEKAVAYGLRDMYLEVISMTIFLLHGYNDMRQYSARIRQFLMDSHESIDEYLGAKP